jgi:regulator of sirC expression with transglutaminase-like and TPR domain
VESKLRSEFSAAIAGPASDVDLLGAALVIAGVRGYAADRDRVEAAVDSIAQAAAAEAGTGADPSALSQAIDLELFARRGFHGDPAGPDDPRNSFLDDVVERRAGIPISLAVLYLAVAGRVGLEAEAVGFPGHVLVRLGGGADGAFVDPFHQGSRLDRAELMAHLSGLELGGLQPGYFLCGVTPRQLLQRMLNNLRRAYRAAKQPGPWRATVDLALCLEPWSASLAGERGMLSYRLGDFEAALPDLERYVEGSEGGRVAAGALRMLGDLRGRQAGGRK